MKVLVVGAGSFGCVIANVVAKNGYNTFLWSYDQKDLLESTYENPFIKGAKLNKTIKIQDTFDNINDMDLVVMVVPSFAIRQTSKTINEIITKPLDFVICTKGLEAGTMKSGKTIIEDEINLINHIGILSGPTHAEELAFEKYTAIVSTSEDLDFAKKVQDIFSAPYLRVYTNTDETGVELLGAAKNVLAIAAGICDSHPKLGDNAKAALITRGLRELNIIGQTQGCKTETFYGLTGLGDLLVTAFSKHSRNRKYGELIGQGLSKDEAEKKVGMVVEGVYSVEALQKLNESTGQNLPIINSIFEVICEDKPVDEIINNMFERERRSE